MMIMMPWMTRKIEEKGKRVVYLDEKGNILRKNTKEITKHQREMEERIRGRLDILEKPKRG